MSVLDCVSVRDCVSECVCVCETQFDRLLGMTVRSLTQWSLPRPCSVPEERNRFI